MSMIYQLIFCAILTFSLFFCSCKSQKESVSVINEEDSESLVLEHIIDNIEQSSENLILIKRRLQKSLRLLFIKMIVQNYLNTQIQNQKIK